MSGHSELVARLQKELSQEYDTRRRQQELNAKLQQEYDVLLKKLAEAELHIDKLRLGANVELNKWYVLRYTTEQNSTLRQRLEAEFEPSNRASPGVAFTQDQEPSPRGVPPTEHRNEAEATLNMSDEGVRLNGSHTISNNSSLLVSQCSSDFNSSVPPQPQQENVPSTTNIHSGVQNGQLVEQANTGIEGSCSQLSLLHLSSHSSLVHISSHTTTDSDELCISQVSSGTIATCGSAESMLLAHLLQLHNLQEQLTALKLKINEGGTSLDEILSDISGIQDGHRQLTADIETSSGHLDKLREKSNRQDFDHITRSREAVGKELANLSTQLQELGELIRTKTPELSQKTDVPPSSSATESVLLSNTGKQGAESDSHTSTFFDSLNSPALPTKYLSHDVITPGSPITEEPLTTESLPPVTKSQSVDNVVATGGTLSSVKTKPSMSLVGSGEHFTNTKSHSTYTGTPLEELLDMDVAGGHGLNVDSREDTLSDLSDILPSDVTQSEEMSQEQVLKEAKHNLEKAEMFRLGVQPLPQTSFTTTLASPLTATSDQSSINPRLIRHSTPASHYKAPPTNHTPSVPYSQPLNDPTDPTPCFKHQPTHSSPFSRPQTTDSGFAGSEIPSRTGKTINALNTAVERHPTNNEDHNSIPYQQLEEESSREDVSILTNLEPKRESSASLTEVSKEPENEQQQEEQEKRPSLTVAAINSLKNELATLREQIMKTVQQQKDYASLKLESHSKSPLFHSHSSLKEGQTHHSSSSTNNTATPLHDSNTEPELLIQSTTVPRMMPGTASNLENHDTSPLLLDNETWFSPNSPTKDEHSLKLTPVRRYKTSRSSSVVSFTPSVQHHDDHTQNVLSTPSRSVTLFNTPLPTPHHYDNVELSSHNRGRPSASGTSTAQQWFSDSGNWDIGRHTCPSCGEQSVKVSSHERVSEDGSKKHRHTTYVHSCQGGGSARGTPVHDDGLLRNRDVAMNISSESNTVMGESLMPPDGRDSKRETRLGGLSVEDHVPIPTTISTPSRFRGTVSRNLITRTTAKGKQRTANSESMSQRNERRRGLFDDDHRWVETSSTHTTTPKHRSTYTEATKRPGYSAHTANRDTSSSSVNSSPTYIQYKSSPEMSYYSDSPHHNLNPHPPGLYRRGSTPAASVTRNTAATYTAPVAHGVHHTRLYHTPNLPKQQVKVHHYPLSSGSNRYRTRYVSRKEDDPRMFRMTSTRKPTTRSSSSECSPEYQPYITQVQTTGQRSKSQRRVIHLVPATHSIEVHHSEPSGVRVATRNKKHRKRRYFDDENNGDTVRGVCVKPRRVYVVEGEECSSDSEREVEVDSMELEEIMKLARELERRSSRMQTSLQTALNRRGVY